MKLTIAGTGKMAEAIIVGAIVHHDIEVVGRSMAKVDALVARYPQLKNAGVFTESFDIDGKNIIFCVKPYAIESASAHFTGEANALLSVLAVTSLSALKSHIKATSYIRTMPNLAASHQKAMTTLLEMRALKTSR